VSKQVFRSPILLLIWWVWVLFAVANLIDLAVQGRDHASLEAAFVLLFLTGAAYVGALRPRIIADADGLTVINPLRDHHVGWPAVASVDATDLIRVRCEWPEGPDGATGRKAVHAWAAGTSRRRQMVAEMRTQRRTRSRFLAGSGSYASAARTPGREPESAEKIVPVLSQRAEEERQAAPDAVAARPVSTWRWQALAAVLIPALALVIVVVL
jgi:hypothetical protein